MPGIHVHLTSVPHQSQQYNFVLRDWEREDFTGEILRPNKPCVFRCGELDNSQNGHYTKLNRDWQFFLFDLACLTVYKKLHGELTKSEYDWLADRFTSVFNSTTAFTNQNHGFEGESGNANFILGYNVTGPLPAIYSLVCGGASLRGNIVTNTKGEKMLNVFAFDGNKPPPDVRTINMQTDPRLFFADTITGIKWGSGYRVFKFPQYDGIDVPVPLVVSKPVYYPLADTRGYEGLVKWSPYYP